ncbi:tetratricopeptide repeat protein [Pyxidicoccus caerfyrddinensis]|uniref:tetratricopeptide repeat protein n=1 Tax=Pyxidicoccus caerfyrddinensis TaxID=2709663 RepID=UPI0013DBF107|nr:tetratricopeptide repeat protein [Pyxidicoccus caerfyrddinensis]
MKRLGKVGLVLGVLALGGPFGCKDEKEEAAKAHRVKGTDHLSKKEFKEAAAEYALSLEADPKQEKVWEKKAYAHMQVGQMAEASQAVMKILEMKTTTAEKAEVLRTLASMHMTAGTTDDAEKYFNEALKLEPKDEASLGWIAEIYAQRGGARSMSAPIIKADLEKSLNYYDQVIAINANSANTYLNKRVVMGRLMEYERQQKEQALSEAAENAKDKAVVEEANARAAEHQKRMDDFQVQFAEMTKKFSEASKAAKAGGAQPAAPAQAKNTP